MRGRRDLSGWAEGLCNVALQSALEQNKNIGRLTPCPAVCVWITPRLLRSTLRGEGRLVVSAIAAFSACAAGGADDAIEDRILRFGVEFSFGPPLGCRWRGVTAKRVGRYGTNLD